MVILKRQPLIAWTPKAFTYHQGLPPPNANKGKLKAGVASSGALHHLKNGEAHCIVTVFLKINEQKGSGAPYHHKTINGWSRSLDNY